jgi:putative transposase
LRCYRKIRRGLMELLARERTIRVGDLMESLETDDATPFIQLIDRGQVYADIDNASLSAIRDVWISTDPVLARLAQDSTSELRRMIAEAIDLDTSDLPNPRYELETATRHAILAGTTDKNTAGEVASPRSVARYKATKKANPDNPLAIDPGWARCGNRDDRFDKLHLALIKSTVRAGRSDKNDSSISSCFKQYEKDYAENREKLGLIDEKPCCRSTFYHYWYTTPLVEGDAAMKGGRRLENAQSDAKDPQTKAVLATRAFAVAHIDHWKCDYFLVVGVVNGKSIVCRPWLTAMVDMFSGEILAIWLSFASPSRRACAMVIRDCIRRHGRLPEMIVTDGGSEFKSAHFLVMLMTLKVIRCERPPEDPRFGQEVEGVFKQFKERFARGMPGYGISIERARAVSAAFKAGKSASLTLMEGFEALEAFIFNGYNNEPKPGTRTLRSQIREQSLAAFPFSGKKVEWNVKLLIATSIAAPSKQYTLWTGRGIHLNDKWYTSPKLLRYRGYKKDFCVRVEPYADSVIYVFIEGKWLICANTDVRDDLAMTDRRLISKTCERHELSALRKEIENECNRETARIVNEKLQEIASRTDDSSQKDKKKTKSKEGEAKEQAPNVAVENDESIDYLPYSFDDIEVLEEDG